MARSIFCTLEEVISHCKSGTPEAARLIKLGKKMLKDEPYLKEFARRQCNIADAALQRKGGYSDLLERINLRDVSHLWNYRQIMAAICDYKPEPVKQLWIDSTEIQPESNSQQAAELIRLTTPSIKVAGVIVKQTEALSLLEICQAFQFGYLGNERTIDVIKKVLELDLGKSRDLLKSVKKSNEKKILLDSSEFSLRYDEFLMDKYPEFYF